MSSKSSALQASPRWSLIIFLSVDTLLMRLVPFAMSRIGFPLNADVTVYPWNFSPFLAVCLFGGARFPSRALAICLPVLLTFAGDAAIFALTGRRDLVSIPISLSVSASAVGCTLLGCGLRERRSMLPHFVAGAAGSLLFFLVTNFVSWVCYDSFPHTLPGLLACYAAGLPFFRNTVISTTVFGGLLFSSLGVKTVEDPSFLPLHAHP